MKCVGLLRGINVGGHGKLMMKDLLEICNNLGYQNTQSYIQSGNIVFDYDSAPDANELSARIFDTHGFHQK